jgi:hypothetical protein
MTNVLNTHKTVKKKLRFPKHLKNNNPEENIWRASGFSIHYFSLSYFFLARDIFYFPLFFLFATYKTIKYCACLCVYYFLSLSLSPVRSRFKYYRWCLYFSFTITCGGILQLNTWYNNNKKNNFLRLQCVSSREMKQTRKMAELHREMG